MRPAQVSAAAGTAFSPWLQHDYYQTPFCLSLAGFVSSNFTGTGWAVQYTEDSLDQTAQRPCLISQTGTVITVTDIGPANQLGNHMLLVGDFVELFSSGIGVDAQYVVATVVSASQYTLTSTVTQTVSGSPNVNVLTARVFPDPTLVTETARAVGTYAFPRRASRLALTAVTAGVVTLHALQGGMST